MEIKMDEKEKPPSDSQGICRPVVNRRTGLSDLYWLSVRGGATVTRLAIHSDSSGNKLR